MAWIVIGLILLAAFGPVLWLLPSKRDRHLAALREQARREGLVVELRHVPKLNPSAHERVTAGGRVKDPKVDCTAYTYSLARRLRNMPGWRLLRGEGTPQIRLGWEFDPDRRPEPGPGFANFGAAFEVSMESLDDLFDGLPGDVIGVELTARSLIIYWLEGRAAKPATVTMLKDLLAAAQLRLLAEDEQLGPDLGDEDS